MSPISSRKTVPPSAISSLPFCRRSAPVKAPRSWPKSSFSSKRFREGDTIDDHQRHGLAWTPLVDGTGEEFLACAAFAEQ